ncbi:MAG: hypothetical protein ACK5KM_13730 [Hyphomicrobiaceae bacterium]
MTQLAGCVLRLQTISELQPDGTSELADHGRLGCLTLDTEKEEMAAEIRSRFDVFVAGATLSPWIIDSDQNQGSTNSTTGVKNAWLIAFFGNPRDEKGAELQPRILSSLRKVVKCKPLAKPIRVFTQTHRLSKLQGPKRKHNYRMMKEVAINQVSPVGVSIQLAFDSIPDEQFLATLNNADLLVLPYMTPPYDTAGSGLIIDGTLVGKAFVHSQGMAMDEFLNCGNAEAAATPEAFGPMIVNMLQQIDKYAAGKAEAKARILRGFDSAGVQLRTLI